MVLDINLFRKEKGGIPDAMKLNQKNRFKNEQSVDKIIELDESWRKSRFSLDTMNRFKNICSSTIGNKMKSKEAIDNSLTLPSNFNLSQINKDLLNVFDIGQIKKVSELIDLESKNIKSTMESLEKEKNTILYEIGNILHKSVIISNCEDDNKIIRCHGDSSVKKPLSHVDLLIMVDGADIERGVNIAGNRAYFLKGVGVLLEQALIQLALSILVEKDYTPLSTPLFIKKEIMKEVAQLNQFDDELYKVIGKTENIVVSHKNDESVKLEEYDEKYLIATSEQPIAAFHRGEQLNEDELPKKYAGISSCFRQEVGSHGRDTRGIFRVHQFQKVEQFVICSPEKNVSWGLFDEMIGNAELFCKTLELPYRIVSIVSGALNNAASLKYDLEAWFPGSQSFRELVSCSNCTDYQARRLNVRYGFNKKENDQPVYCHMLNSTMCATTRVICCLLENHQTSEGIKVPSALQRFLPEKYHFIRFVRPVPAH